MMQIVMSFLMISMISIILPRASVSANRINEILETEESIKEIENPEKLFFMFTIKGCYSSIDYLKPKYANAEIEWFCPLSQDKILAVIRVADDSDIWIPEAGREYYRINFETMKAEKCIAGNTPDAYRNDDNIFTSDREAIKAIDSIKAILYTNRRCW